MAGSYQHDDGSWMARAQAVTHVTCDAVFYWAPDVYFGPPNDFTAAQWAELRETLPPPDLPGLGGSDIPTAALLGHEDALISHCRRIEAIARRRDLPQVLREPFPYFRIMAVIHDGAEMLTSTPWFDSESYARGLLAAIAAAPGADERGVVEVFDDTDQGWELRMLRAEGRLFVREWNPDEPDAADGRVELVLDAAAMATDASVALDRLRIVHARLVSALGVDYWNHRPSKDDANSK